MKTKPPHFVMLAVVLVLLVVSLFFVATHTDAYEEAERFSRQDHRVTDLVGNVVEVHLRFWDGFEFTSAGNGGEANFVLDVVGVNRKAIMDIRLHRLAGRWYEEVAYIRVNGDIDVHTIYGEQRKRQ